MVIIVTKNGMDITPEELLDWCSERMPYFAIPRYVRFQNALPKTPNEKVRKTVLRNQGVTEDTWDREKSGYTLKK